MLGFALIFQISSKSLAQNQKRRSIPLGIFGGGNTGTQSAGSCQVSCSQDADIQVDLGSKCLCMKKADGSRDCISIAIGSGGTTDTSAMPGGAQTEMKGCEGDKYTYWGGSGSGGQSCDDKVSASRPPKKGESEADCIATGVPDNDNVGKWIHKVGSAAGSTLGCIGVEGKDWCKVKEAALGSAMKKEGDHKKLTICGGAKINTGTAKAGGKSGDQ